MVRRRRYILSRDLADEIEVNDVVWPKTILPIRDHFDDCFSYDGTLFQFYKMFLTIAETNRLDVFVPA